MSIHMRGIQCNVVAQAQTGYFDFAKGLLILTLVGCSRFPPEPAFPKIDPRQAAIEALGKYDKDGDGRLSADEMSPSLKAALAQVDRDADGNISEGELADRVTDWLESGDALVEAIVQVTLDGKPLVAAKVTVEPESFLGSTYESVQSITDETGLATFRGHDPNLPGLHLGFYTVRISKLTEDGIELVPQEYNVQSALGIEVAGDRSNLALFALKR